jgi:hypothetical protein
MYIYVCACVCVWCGSMKWSIDMHMRAHVYMISVLMSFLAGLRLRLRGRRQALRRRWAIWRRRCCRRGTGADATRPHSKWSAHTHTHTHTHTERSCAHHYMLWHCAVCVLVVTRSHTRTHTQLAHSHTYSRILSLSWCRGGRCGW